MSRIRTRPVLPRLPSAFWQALAEARCAWQGLNAILDEERDGLLRNEISVLWKTADKKNMQVEHIKEKESALTRMAQLIVERCGLAGDGDPRRAIRAVLHPADLSRFDAELSALQCEREGAMERNRRHGRWLRERLELTKRLAENLIHASGGSTTAVYSPSGELSGERSRRVYLHGVF